VKEASGNLGQVMEILRDRPQGFEVLSGDDALTLAFMALGGEGVISVAANQVPRAMHVLTTACARGDFAEARRLHHRLLRLMNLNFVESSPIPVKTSLALMGLCSETFRLPLCPATDAQTLKERIDFDLGLSAHLLRVANSSTHAPVVPVTSVQLAIARLGMENIREIVLAIIVRNKMFSVPGQEVAAREIWRRSALRCSFAQAICKKSRSGASRGTTVSLLLDIGQPVVLSARRKLEKQLGGALSDDSFAALAQKLHPPVGAELVRRWSMPTWLETVIRLQRTPSKCVEHPAEAWLAHLADRMAGWCAEKDEDAAGRIAGDPAWLELGLSASDVRAILADAARIERHAAIYR
jgi:HD-like signal output (HDOD) protein